MSTFLRRHSQRLPEVEAFRVYSDSQGQVILGKGLTKKERLAEPIATTSTTAITDPDAAGIKARLWTRGTVHRRFRSALQRPTRTFRRGHLGARIPLGERLLAQFTIGPPAAPSCCGMPMPADHPFSRSPTSRQGSWQQCGHELQKIIRSAMPFQYLFATSADG